MKTRIFILFFILPQMLIAQQKTFYSQYVLNNFILNPAITGIENYTDVKLSYRNQWTNINGAPATTYISVHGPIGKSDYNTNATSYEVPGENPRGKEYWKNYEAPAPHHGIGFMAVNDRSGYLNRWGIFASYAYHKPLSSNITLAAGFRAGINSVHLDRSKIEWGDLDPNDPSVRSTIDVLHSATAEGGAGLWLYGKNFFTGASVLNIVPGKVQLVTNDKYGVSYKPAYFFSGGYRFFLNDDVSVLPSAVLNIIQPQPMQVNTNIKVQYRDLLWGGAGYRFGDELGGLTAMAGLRIGNNVNISYSYDMATNSAMRTYAGNTHEFLLGFVIGNQYGSGCPRNVW